MTTRTKDVRYYSGWQRERSGFLFSLSGPRFVLLLGAFLCVALPVSTGSLALLVLTGPTAAVLAGLTWARIGGRTATEWSLLAVNFVINRTRGQNTFRSGAFAPVDPAKPSAPAPMDLPGPLAALHFLEAETAGLLIGPNRIAVVHHPLDQTYAAVARINVPGIALADSAVRKARIAGWGGFLAQHCIEASPFVRVSVVQRTVPDDATELCTWHRQTLRPDAPEAALRVVDELLAQVTLTGSQQTTWLVLTLDAERARPQIRAAGGGDVGALAFLVRQLAAVSAAIGGAHLEIDHWVGVRELAEVIRTGFDPTTTVPPGGIEPRHAGPAAAEAHWDHYRHDSGFSVTYEVSDWPRTGVPAWFLRPVLSARQEARRSFALIVEPITARQAEKVVMRERTKRTVAVRLRNKTGQLVPEHEIQALDDAEQMDCLRAAGHGLVRFVAYVSVTVTDHGYLSLACAELETDAGQCGLTVRRLFGAQDVGFQAAALPLGLGLPQVAELGMIWRRRVDERTVTPVDLAQFILVPRQQAPAKAGKPAPTDRRRFAPRKGWSGPNAGRAAVPLRPQTYRAITAQVQGVFPFIGGSNVPAVGPVIGWDVLTRATFTCHPIEWLRHNLVTNTNILYTGSPGSGKSATMKALSLRLTAFGVKVLVAGDIKNEYAPMCRALGVEPVELGLGLPARLNPLDAGPLGKDLPRDSDAARERLDEIHRRRVSLLETLLTMQIGRALTPFEKAATSYALRRSTGEFSGATTLVDPTIPQVWKVLANPDTNLALDLGLPRADAELARDKLEHVRHGLGNMVEGPLGGLFDAPSTVRLDFDAPIQSVDLSRMEGRGDETVAMTLACVSSWAQAAIDMPGGVRAVVRDEVWRAMRIPAMIRKIDSDLRLSRSQGTIQMLSTHRLSDFEQVGGAGSEEVAIARNLIASCDTRVQLAQDTKALAMTREAVGLTDAECEHIGSWSAEHKGFALWKIGRAASHIVRTTLSPWEQELFHTNEKMVI